MKEWLKKITGYNKVEELKQQAADLEKQIVDSTEAAKAATEAEELAKLSPKARATRKGEPWVAVLDTKVNPDNIRNGFFELDWNEHFLLQLKQNGYGSDGDPEEEIVDRWFRDIVAQMLEEEGLDPASRGAGFINVVPIAKGKSEVS
jgi:hypothetical protein